MWQRREGYMEREEAESYGEREETEGSIIFTTFKLLRKKKTSEVKVK